MAVEGLVLGRKERLDQARRHRLDRHEDTFFTGMFGDQRPVARMYAGGNRRLVTCQLVIVGKVLAIGPENPENTRRGPDEPQKQKAEKHRHKADKTHKKGLAPFAPYSVGQVQRFVILIDVIALIHGVFIIFAVRIPPDRRRWPAPAFRQASRDSLAA